MLVWQFISIYIANAFASILANCCGHELCSSVIFTVIYILSFFGLNKVGVETIIQPQTITAEMIILPITALILQYIDGKTITFNSNNLISNTLVESFASSIVEEELFRVLIPANFNNSIIGVIISGLLFAVIHIKSWNAIKDWKLMIKLFSSCMLFNILMFQFKPSNFIAHFLWNFITISMVNHDNTETSSTITELETSITTMILFAIVIAWNWWNKKPTESGQPK